MGRAATSLAERYRAHRRAFELALELDCTPREAEAVLRMRDAQAKVRARWQKCERRLQADRAVEPTAAPREEETVDREPWMMRD